jgi:ribonuclease III
MNFRCSQSRDRHIKIRVSLPFFVLCDDVQLLVRMLSIDEILSLCESRIDYTFQDRSLLRRCLTHSSSAETRLDSNERLEFLGDAVLGLIICEHLFQIFPDQREGQLTQMKSWLVSRATCARVARVLDLASLILVGRGLQSLPDSIMSAVVESLIAGVYVDGGLDSARAFVLFAFRDELTLCRPLDTENFKSQLQELTQRELGKTPEYILLEELGPDHAREFEIAARIGDRTFESGRGRSKKEAEQQAARNAVLTLRRIEDDPKSDSEQSATSGSGLADVPIDISHRLFNQEPDAMKSVAADVIYKPHLEELRFLPEGPYLLEDGRVSWVGIQHGADSLTGSINLLNPTTRINQRFDLPGRPGFAFPTDRPGVFVTGVERSVGLFDTNTGEWSPFIENVDADVSNTIINDAVVFEGNLIFGCKELEFKTRKAGLYLWRRRDQKVIQLRSDQICSNGKAIVRQIDGRLTLYDIDSPSKQITQCTLDIDAGTVGPPQVVVDLTDENVFPDGMILTPDHRSLIVALYNPGDPPAGEARQYSLATGSLEAVWTCPGSPRVTCPQLISVGTSVGLLLTTAVEHMPAEQRATHPAAGCLFLGETDFTTVGDQPLFPCPQLS